MGGSKPKTPRQKLFRAISTYNQKEFENIKGKVKQKNRIDKANELIFERGKTPVKSITSLPSIKGYSSVTSRGDVTQRAKTPAKTERARPKTV